MKIRKHNKKIKKNVINKIEKLSPNKGDVIVMHTDTHHNPSQDARSIRIICNAIKDIFKKNTVIVIPTETQLVVCGEKELLEYRKSIDKIIDTLHGGV